MPSELMAPAWSVNAPSAVDQIEALGNGDVLYAVSTYLRPRYYAHWSAAGSKSEETKLKVTSPIKGVILGGGQHSVSVAVDVVVSEGVG